MNYQRIYNQIIERAQVQKRKRLENENPDYIYYELHHILPRCMGGEDILENLVLLTAREHFLVHWLLARIYSENKKVGFAFYAMCNFKGSSKKRYTPSSRAFKEAKELYNKNVKGIELSKERKLKIKLSKEKETLEEKAIRVSKMRETFKSKSNEELKQIQTKKKESIKNQTKEKREEIKLKRKLSWENKSIKQKKKIIDKINKTHSKRSEEEKRISLEKGLRKKSKNKELGLSKPSGPWSNKSEVERLIIKENIRKSKELKKIERENNPELMKIYKEKREVSKIKRSLTMSLKSKEQLSFSRQKGIETYKRNKEIN